MTEQEGKNFKRRIFWIDPRGQGSYLNRILFLEVLVATVSALLTAFLTIFVMWQGPNISSPTSYWLLIFGYLLVMCLIMGGVLVWLGIRLSHRIYGPAFRINKTFTEHGDSGKPLPEINLRKNDEFKPLAVSINHYSRNLREQQEDSLKCMMSIVDELSTVRQSVEILSPAPEQEKALSAIDRPHDNLQNQCDTM